VTRGGWRDDVVLRLDLPAEVPVSDLPIVLPSGLAVPIAALADVSVVDRPALVRRQDGSRRVVVMANVRGRDLGAFVADARAAVDGVDLPEGYRLGWAGSFEQLAEASRRMALLVPLVLLTILFLLRGTFGAFRPAWLILMNVPLAVSGGLFALAARGLPISMSAIVGFIALFGIAVMNGIVLVARVLERAQGQPVAEAARHAARERFRPVLTTATVAGLGFVPMAVATGVGAEVQRPLATVVLGGLLTSTLLTLVVLPAVAPWILRRAPTGPEPTPYEPGGPPDPDAILRDAEEALEAS
jgi:cobalt-zinc-cadmium resistance protein CzcA